MKSYLFRPFTIGTRKDDEPRFDRSPLIIEVVMVVQLRRGAELALPENDWVWPSLAV